MTLLAQRTDFDRRVAALGRPRPSAGRLAAGIVLAVFAVLGIVAVYRIFSAGPLSLDALPQWLRRTTPLVWPGFTYDPVTKSAVFESWSGVWAFVRLIGVTLGIVLSGTFLSAVLSVPVARWAARNTTASPALVWFARTIGVVARAVPDIAFAGLFVFAMAAGALPGILAIMLHSIGMISKMFADAIEQIDEGPRTAVRAAGATRRQEFWSGVFPQVLPAWIAIALHRADINLRHSIVLGYVGVAGLGVQFQTWLAPLNYRRAIPYAITMVFLCIVFEIVSSMIRSRLLGVQPSGRGLGDRVVRAAARRSSVVATGLTRSGVADHSSADRFSADRFRADRGAAVEKALHRPWTADRRSSTVWIWAGVLVIVGSFVLSDAKWSDLFTFWQFLPDLADRAWPLSFGTYQTGEVLTAILDTIEIAFASTVLSVIVVVVIGPLAARNVARSGLLRNSFRGVLLAVRGIPEIIFAIFLVIIMGLGPGPATIALSVAGVGLLGKLVADSIEEVPGGPERAILAAGGTRLQVFSASTVAYGIPSFVGHSLYLLEQNVRAATIVGAVGGGGIGDILLDSIRISRYDTVLAIVLILIPLGMLVEGIAVLIRRVVR